MNLSPETQKNDQKWLWGFPHILKFCSEMLDWQPILIPVWVDSHVLCMATDTAAISYLVFETVAQRIGVCSGLWRGKSGDFANKMGLFLAVSPASWHWFFGCRIQDLFLNRLTYLNSICIFATAEKAIHQNMKLVSRFAHSLWGAQ